MFSSPNVTVKILYPPARRLSLINWWNKTAKNYINRINPDIFVCMDGQFSAGIKVPILNVIHDLNFLHHPEWMSKKLAKFYNSSFPECAKNSTRIATVSTYSKNDIHKSYGISNSLIDVVYNGYNEELTQLKNTPNSENPFFLFVGIQVPRKNIVGLIKSFTLFKQNYGTNHKLKLAGHDYMWNSEMKQALYDSTAKIDIELLGRQTFNDLKELYEKAEALLYIPHFEGFGIPVLEGFAAGLPVICSNTTSLPEVAGDAALKCAPTDYKLVSENMYRITSDSEFRAHAVKKGKSRLAHFSWKKTSESLWNSLEKAVGL